jgi:hypothetical protein
MCNDKDKENFQPGSVTSTISQSIQKMYIRLNILRKLPSLKVRRGQGSSWAVAPWRRRI